MNTRKIAIGSDHAGFQFKATIISWLEEQGWSAIDLGPDSENSVDYPDFIHPVAIEVEKENADSGIIICGSGNGAAMTANKHQNIRAALCWTPELAQLARLHNDANVLSIPARFVQLDTALQMVEVFMNTEFEGGRHKRRVDKISCC